MDLTEGSYDIELIQLPSDTIFSGGFSKSMLLKLPHFNQVDLEVKAEVIIGINDTIFYEYNNDSRYFRTGTNELTF